MIRRASPWQGVFWWAAVGVLWVAALWRVPHVLGGPWMPDGLLLALLAWAFAQKAQPSAMSALGRGAAVGGLKDLISSGPFGGWLVVYAVTAWLATRAARTIARDDAWSQVLWVAVFSLGTIVAQAIWLSAHGDGVTGGAVFRSFWFASPVATGLASLALFPLIKRVS